MKTRPEERAGWWRNLWNLLRGERGVTSKKKAEKVRLSAQVKSRLLFSREIGIDSKNETRLVTDDVLAGLIDRKSDAASSRDKMIRNAILSLLAAYALYFNLNIRIPNLEITPDQVQLMVTFLTCLSAIGLLQAMIFLDSESAYDGLIDAIINEKSSSKYVDPDILKSSHQTQFMFLKTLRPDFNLYNEDSIKTKKFGRLIYFLTTGLITSIWTCMILAIYASIVYLTIVAFPIGIWGWLFAVFCWVSIFAAILIQQVPNVPFEVQDTLIDGDDPE